MIVDRPGTASLRDNLISKQRVRLKIVCLVLSVTLVSLGMIRAAEATQDPPGCTTNAVAFDIAKDKNNVVNGDIVTYTITVGNGGTPACTAKNLVVQAHCPNSSGNPTIAATVAVQNAIPNPLPVPQATFTYGTFPCTINVSSGVTTAQAQATLSGFLNDLAGIDD